MATEKYKQEVSENLYTLTCGSKLRDFSQTTTVDCKGVETAFLCLSSLRPVRSLVQNSIYPRRRILILLGKLISFLGTSSLISEAYQCLLGSTLYSRGTSSPKSEEGHLPEKYWFSNEFLTYITHYYRFIRCRVL